MQDLLVAACGLLSCGMHAGSSSPTRDRTWAPCTGSSESYPLDHRGSPPFFFYGPQRLQTPPSSDILRPSVFVTAVTHHSLGFSCLPDSLLLGKWALFPPSWSSPRANRCPLPCRMCVCVCVCVCVGGGVQPKSFTKLAFLSKSF